MAATTHLPVWICPKCGARLVSRNLWHSCGQFTLEALFAGSKPEILAAARKYVALLASLGDVQILPIRREGADGESGPGGPNRRGRNATVNG